MKNGSMHTQQNCSVVANSMAAGGTLDSVGLAAAQERTCENTDAFRQIEGATTD